MSRNEWEQCTIVLPSAAVASLKQALRKAQNEMYDAILDVAKRWEPHYVDQKPRRGYLVNLPESRTEVERHTHGAISSRFQQRAGKDRLGRLVASDLDWEVGPRATNRTTTYRCGHAELTIDGRELHWRVDENNRSRTQAHEEFLYRTLERFLSRVTWTRGTGGIFFGNDECHEESLGASGDYITASYGPLGKKQSEDWSGYGRSRW